MASKSLTIRLARGSFGLAAAGLLAPGLHSNLTTPAARARTALEGYILGVSFAAVAVVLALVTLRRFRSESDIAGKRWANAALVDGAAVAVLWSVVSLIGARA